MGLQANSMENPIDCSDWNLGREGRNICTQISHKIQSRCNYVTLVKCFIEILDKWTWTLYELKDNVVTINAEQCQHLRELDKCIQVNFHVLAKKSQMNQITEKK